MASRAQRQQPIRWSENRGRDGWTIPTNIPEGLSAESMNIILEKGTIGRKRRGSAAQAFSGSTITTYEQIFRFTPAQDDTAAETIIVSIVSATNEIHRVAGGTTAVELTLTDAIATAPHLVRGATLNGKFYLAYDSAVNRLHVFAPAESTTTVRRAGMAAPAAPTVADQGSGSLPAYARYYRTAERVKSGSTILRQSLLGTVSTVFTPAGTGQYARVTKPADEGEGATHWVVYGAEQITEDSGDVGPGVFYELAETAVATTTYDDDDDPATYDENDEAPDEGAFTPFPSVKYLLSTGERLIGLGVWESSAGDSMTPRAGRLYFTPVLDTTDTDDDERISNTTDFQGWIDVARNAGAEDRALGGPMDGAFFAFQSRGVYMFVPTGNANAPYKRITLSPELGAVSQESTFMGEDEAGRSCLYFLDPVRGPYRYGARGLQWLGYDVQDVWATVNLAATTRVAAGVWDAEKRAAVWGIATGSANVLSEIIEFFAREARATVTEGTRGGWVRAAGASAFTFRCVALLPETYGATMSRALKAYFGHSTKLLRWNDESVQQDDSVSYQAYAIDRARDTGRFEQRKRITEPYLQAGAATGVTITASLGRNFGDETARTGTVSLSAVGSETRVLRKFEGLELADAQVIQITLGDSAAANNAWTLDELNIPVEVTDFA